LEEFKLDLAPQVVEILSFTKRVAGAGGVEGMGGLLCPLSAVLCYRQSKG